MASCILQFTGDISIDGSLTLPESQELIVESARWLSQETPPADLRIVNWEAPLEGHEGPHEMDKPIVGTTANAARNLLGFKINVATIANNHIFDFKGSGVRNTIKFLNSNSIRTLGAGNTPGQAYNPLHMDINEVSLTFLAYVGTDTNPPPEESDMFLNILEPEKVLRAVRKWSMLGRKVIVCFHWGVEYESYPSPSRRSFARQVIESGAMLVVCHHAHRLQGHEQWMHGHIFYGLGNFIFGPDDGESWPFFTNPTAIAYCQINDDFVSNAGLLHLSQSVGVMKKPPIRQSEKLESALNWPLNLSERVYSKFWRLANIHHLIYEKPLEAFQRRGAKAFLRINMDHVKGLVKALSFGKLRRPGKNYR